MNIRENKLYQKELRELCDENLPFEELRGSGILLTGATGMIGSYMADFLLRLNQEKKLRLHLYAVCRSRNRAEQQFEKYLNRRDFTIIEADLNSPFIVPDIRFNYVIHAAGNNHPRAFAQEPVETMKTAIQGTIQLLDMAAEQDVKGFLFVSTGEVYGEQMQNHEDGCSEENPGTVDTMQTRSCYPEGKRAGETLCKAYFAEYQIQTVIARLCYVYGPTMQAGSSKADVQFMQKAMLGENLVLKSDGMQYRSYLYLQDACRGLLYALLRGIPGEAYNIASPENRLTIRELAQTIARQAGVMVEYEHPEIVEAAGYSAMKREILSSNKLEKLGFKAEISIREGIRRSLDILMSDVE